MFAICCLAACQEPSDRDGSRETAVIGSLKVVLLPGVHRADLGLTDEQVRARLSGVPGKRSGSSADGGAEVPAETVIGAIDSAIASAVLPDLTDPAAADLSPIRADFPELSDDEIRDQWEPIRQIYLDQVSALSLSSVVQELADSPDEPPVPAATYYGKITSCEVAVMIRYPFSALSGLAARDKAFELTAQYMGASRADDKTDAFRHAIWHIMMAKTGAGLKQERLNWARDFGRAHEECAYAGMASEMDLHNNDVGLAYYNANTTKTYTTFLWWTWESGVREPSNEGAAQAIKAKAKAAVFVDKSLAIAPGKAAIAAAGGKLVYIIPDSNQY
jgi:hypothetical protein